MDEFASRRWPSCLDQPVHAEFNTVLGRCLSEIAHRSRCCRLCRCQRRNKILRLFFMKRRDRHVTAGARLMSLTIIVPAALPSVFQSSNPCLPSSARILDYLNAKTSAEIQTWPVSRAPRHAVLLAGQLSRIEQPAVLTDGKPVHD